MELKEMSELENIKKYMLLGSELPITLKKCMEYELLLIVFSLPLGIIMIDGGYYLFSCLYLLPIILNLICAMKLKKGKAISGVSCILYNGIYAGCLSFVFVLIGIEMMILFLFEGIELVVMIGLVCAGYLVMLKLCGHIFRKQIEKIKGSGIKRDEKWMPIALFGGLGIATGRVIVKIVDNKTVAAMASICCIFVSYVCLIGVGNILKYRYIMNHKDMFNE